MVLKIVHEPRMSFSPEALLSELFGHSTMASGSELARTPAVDVAEHKDRYELLAELPGVKKQDVQIRLEKGVLTLSGERKPTIRKESASELHSEVSFGKFERSFVLPKDVDAGQLDAELSDGILKITMPKSEKALPREISVK